jgi:hypothetical protein
VRLQETFCYRGQNAATRTNLHGAPPIWLPSVVDALAGIYRPRGIVARGTRRLVQDNRQIFSYQHFSTDLLKSPLRFLS